MPTAAPFAAICSLRVARKHRSAPRVKYNRHISRRGIPFMDRIALLLSSSILLMSAAAAAASTATDSSEAIASELRDKAMDGNSVAWDFVSELTTRIGPRPAGSPAEAAAAEWSA